MALNSSKKKLDESYERVGGSNGIALHSASIDAVDKFRAGATSETQVSRFVVTTINAQYKPGMVDGLNSSARFRSPTAICEVPAVALRSAVLAGALVADTGNNTLRLVELIGTSQPGAPAGAPPVQPAAPAAPPPVAGP